MLWWHWLILGLILIGMEILTLGGLGNFYFLFFGMAAVLVSLLVWLGLNEPIYLQWFLFGVFGIVSFFALRKPLQAKASFGKQDELPVDSMVGEHAILVEDIDAQRVGRAELRGSTWSARNAGTTALLKGTSAKVIRVEGLTLWLKN
ncbi:MAG: NfeD family protein [Nitrospirales bacterium]